MVFSSNPLSLSVPDQAFDSWLRDSGYLDVLDQRTSDLHHLTAATGTATSLAVDILSSSNATTTAFATGFFVSLFSRIGTLLSLLTANPFAKLVAEDFSGETPAWTPGFIGFFGSYSFPSTPAQARLRIHENVKRYARNYASLFILFFACSLYQMPLALVGILFCLALWDAFKFCSDRWGLGQYPILLPCLVAVAQCATAIILIWSQVPMALFCALGISYTAMILHASLRKLSPTKPPSIGRRK